MTTLRDRWTTGKLVGDKQHVLVVRIRTGHMARGYGESMRIDTGHPIIPPQIFKGVNHAPWTATWTPTSPWRTLPNIQSAKHGRSFAQKGSSTLTVLMDNVHFTEQTGAGGLYHLIERGYFSPMRGNDLVGRGLLWGDTGWTDFLTGGCQIEVWEGYGTGADVVPLAVPDPVTHSCAPSDAIKRTWTGLIEDVDMESHPDHITITARDFGILFTDQRLQGDNKARECVAPITFADRKKVLGEDEIPPLPFNTAYRDLLPQVQSWGPQPTDLPVFFAYDATDDGGILVIESGPSSYGQPHLSDSHDSADDFWWVEMTITGYMDEFMCNPKFEGMEAWVCVYMGNDTGTVDGEAAPTGWVDLGLGSAPDGTPFVRHWGQMPVGQGKQIWQFGRLLYLPGVSDVTYTPHHFNNKSRVRVYFSKLAQLGEQDIYHTTWGTGGSNFTTTPTMIRPAGKFYAWADIGMLPYGTDPSKPTIGTYTTLWAGPDTNPLTSGLVNADYWILVRDAAEIVEMLTIWAGFKEWIIEPFGWTIQMPMQYGEDKFFVDVIDDVLAQGNFVFFMGPPTNDDRSIGVPHLEYQRTLFAPPPGLLEVRDENLLEAAEVRWSLGDLPEVIRYRGNPVDDGRTYEQDLVPAYAATYYPPWSARIDDSVPFGAGEPGTVHRTAGVVRHFIQSVGAGVVIGLNSNEECLFACILAAIQYALAMCTGRVQIPGLPEFLLNNQVSVIDQGVGVNSRLWLASIESTHTLGPNGKWEMVLSGSYIDIEDYDVLRYDYGLAYSLMQPLLRPSGEATPATGPPEYADRSMAITWAWNPFTV